MIYQSMHRILLAAPPRRLTLTASARPLSNAAASLDKRKQSLKQPRGSTRPDWRELFRSAEYDDAWSPYIPLIGHNKPELNGESANDFKLNAKSGTIEVKHNTIQDLIEGRWQKRRHGMNLVPLTMKQKDAESSNDIEILQATAQYEGRLRWLESQTRFLCSMLDDLYRTGIRRQIDRGRTERCHRVIGKLLTLTPPLNSEIQLPFTFSGLAHRAASILDKIERCSPVSLQNVKPVQRNEIQTSKRAGSYRLPQHLPYTKHALPFPTAEIYNMVLLLHAKESGPACIAEEAEDVIWSMIERYMQQRELNTSNKESSILPSKENWDCVLRCWSKSTDSDRAFRAYAYVESWKRWNAHMKEQRDKAIDIYGPDLFSFHLLLETCLADGEKEERAAGIGSKVATQLWDEAKESPLFKEFDSETYCLLLACLCQKSSIKRNKSFALAKRVFQSCCEHGMLTVEVLDAVRDAVPDETFLQMVGGKKDKYVGDDKKPLPSEAIVKEVPIDWVKRLFFSA